MQLLVGQNERMGLVVTDGDIAAHAGNMVA